MSESIITSIYNWLLESGGFVRWCMLVWLATALLHVVLTGVKFILWAML